MLLSEYIENLSESGFCVTQRERDLAMDIIQRHGPTLDRMIVASAFAPLSEDDAGAETTAGSPRVTLTDLVRAGFLEPGRRMLYTRNHLDVPVSVVEGANPLKQVLPCTESGTVMGYFKGHPERQHEISLDGKRPLILVEGSELSGFLATKRLAEETGQATSSGAYQWSVYWFVAEGIHKGKSFLDVHRRIAAQ